MLSFFRDNSSIMPLVKAYFFGLTLAFAIGPMALLITQRCVTFGLKSGVATALGIALADLSYALIAFSIGSVILSFAKAFEFHLNFLSSIVLLVLALYIFSSSIRNYKMGDPTKECRIKNIKAKYHLLSAYALTAFNPLTLAIFLAFLVQVKGANSMSEIVTLSFAIFLGSLTGQLSIAYAAHGTRNFFAKPIHVFYLNLISGFGILTFSLLGLIGA